MRLPGAMDDRGTASRRTCWRTGKTFGRVPELLGHTSVETTMIDAHVLIHGGFGGAQTGQLIDGWKERGRTVRFRVLECALGLAPSANH